jgi:type II secretory pathway pseudopilin PulG
MNSRASSWRSQRGYTMVEVIVVGALVIVGSVVAIPVTIRMVNNAKGDSSVVMTATFLQAGRNRAIAERRNVELSFPDDSTMQLSRIDPITLEATVVDTLRLEDDQKFYRDGDTPAPDDMEDVGDNAINFSGPEPVAFTSDGSLIDGNGDVTNGTIFIGKVGNQETTGAVSIWGVSGLLRSWKWRGGSWLD